MTIHLLRVCFRFGIQQIRMHFPGAKMWGEYFVSVRTRITDEMMAQQTSVFISVLGMRMAVNQHVCHFLQLKVSSLYATLLEG